MTKMNRSLKILSMINIILGIGLGFLFFTMLPFAHGVAADTANRAGQEYPKLENWELLLYALSPGVIIGITTFFGININKRSRKKSFILLSFFPVLIPVYIFIQFATSF